MSKGIIVFGNGFDLDLGLETSYVSFAKSEQWSSLMDNNPNSNNKDRLLGFLKNKYDVEKWVDIEAALLEFALLKTRFASFDHSKEDEQDYVNLCMSLKSYIKKQQDYFNTSKKSVASFLLKYIAKKISKIKLYSFNYTQLDVLAKNFDCNLNSDAVHIHGALNDDGNVILGIETKEHIDDHYAFLYKTQNRNYRHTDILKDLRDKDEYVFFGHSLNGMDFSYFSSLFGHLEGGSISTPKLTIITKDEEEEYKFKNYLRRQHFSLQGLYSNSDPTFILTDEFYKKNEEEQRKVVDLLNRIDMM